MKRYQVEHTTRGQTRTWVRSGLPYGSRVSAMQEAYDLARHRGVDTRVVEVDDAPAELCGYDGYYLPQDDATRKAAPMFRGLLAYFPAALFEVAAHSLDNDRKHNPNRADGEYAPTWAKGKSGDHEDTIARHLIEAGPRRSLWAELGSLVPSWLREKLPGYSAKDARRYHLRAIAWRALALLQEDCEADGAAWGSSARGEKPAGE